MPGTLTSVGVCHVQTKTRWRCWPGWRWPGRFCWRRWWLPHQPGRRRDLGANGWGQLGDSTTYSKVPVVVDRSGVLAGKTVTAISAGDRRVVVAARGAYCWGGERPVGSWDSLCRLCRSRWTPGCWPARRSPRSPPATITCAVADGQTFCWGRNKQQRRDEVEGAGSGEHRRAAAPYIGHRDRRRRTALSAAIAVPMTSVPPPPTATTVSRRRSRNAR